MWKKKNNTKKKCVFYKTRTNKKTLSLRREVVTLVCKMFGGMPKPIINKLCREGLTIDSISFCPGLFESFDKSDIIIVL